MIRNDNPDKGTETTEYGNLNICVEGLEMITPIRGRKLLSAMSCFSARLD